MRGARPKTEVSKEEFEKFLADNPDLTFDGIRYTKKVPMLGGFWNKPMASRENGKLYLIHDQNKKA